MAFPRTTRTTERPPNNLPLQLTSFVGREREVAEVQRLLGGARLLTLCGPGGCGKTRLALAVAQDLLEAFEEDGVWWVELASLSDPNLVPGALASALGVRETPDRSPTEMLVEHLKPRKTLLVLDNCEHLVEVCAVLADTLLRACSDLTILATSREPLRVAGEATWTVPSLSLPDPQRLPPTGELALYEAIRLFVERAEAADAGFALTERNASAVSRLCQKLDGIPLAIELAAARTRALTVEQISEKLEDPLGLLTTGSRTAAPRHQTLRATLEWSYELLGEAERELFERLSVFAGGWDLEGAEAVGAAEPAQAGWVLDLLSNLVDKSLVVVEASPVDAGAAPRYGMLEPVRQYALGRLVEGGEAQRVRERHAGFYLELAEAAEPELKGPRQVPWVERLGREHDNLGAAMRWLLGRGEAGEAARLGWALWLFWWIRGRFVEGRRWMEEALARDASMPETSRARALFVAGTMACGQADYGAAAALLEESLALFRGLGDEKGIAYASSSAGFATIGQGRHEEGIPLLEEAVDLSLEIGEKWGAAFMLCFLAVVRRDQGDVDLAGRLAERGLELSREVGDREGTSMALYVLAGLARASGERERAQDLFEEGLGLAAEVGDETNVAYCLQGLAAVATSEGKAERATRLWGAAEALLERIEAAAYIHAPDHSLYQSRIAAARVNLGEKAFEGAWAQGRAMSPEQAIEYALGGRTEEPPAASPTTVAPQRTLKPLRFFALGPAQVERGEHTLAPSDFGYAKPRELLFYLLSHPEGRTKEHIGLDLWPEASPSQLRGSLHEALRRLRRALGASEWIVHHRGGHYAFERSLEYSLDVEAFEASLDAAAQAPGRQAIPRLQEAVRLYRGEFLEDFLDSEWATERREELQHKHRQALLSLGGLLLEEGRHEQAAEVYRKAISDDEYQEGAHRGLMRCYALMGERGRALEYYRALVEVLREGLGTGPAPETRALYEGLRRGDEGV